MSIHEIENMTFAELKEKRAELTEALKGIPPEELVNRYLQARTDAKQRDDKLAEQGKTITALQDGNAAICEKVAALEEQLSSAKSTIEDCVRESNAARTAYSDEVKALNREYEGLQDQSQTEIDGLKRLLQEQGNRADRLKTQAVLNQAALTGAAKLLNDAISAKQIEDADTGE